MFQLSLIRIYIPKVEKTPTTSAFLQQQKKLKLSAFQTFFYRFNDPFPDKTLYNLHILSVDGTGVTVPMDRINENKEYARVRTNKDSTRPAYQFHVSCIYDLINERYCDAYIEPFRTHKMCIRDRINPALSNASLFSSFNKYSRISSSLVQSCLLYTSRCV